MKKILAISGVGFCCMASPVAGEVRQASAEGFVSENRASVAASPSGVWAALVNPASWWNGEHSWSTDADNFSLDPRAGGCFCETIPAAEGRQAGSVEHMRVINAVPGQQLRMVGALGPLQGEALQAVLTIDLQAEGEGTAISFTYVVGGYARYPLEQLAPAVDSVMSEQLMRLGNLLESGTP
ncbi:uncharacterized protein YndB with AHSA1/START domain [Altererythrobacter atlanticus]|uniref:Activator of Hsp90 ATPase homologue 1/2-like C-terminal domain-containing protein n=1 Tax=Croceibacterium atlanticum TaxID=1267766 RepID=A0A0F7KPX4_9SPHN|nr:SRPBCC domain-containing protein [Croceibacterium atlanticum]AKH41167.1 hypothetical protein WYH_00101 [Croceibacterium atlanticum]MBB5732683.1 uncharacterized protein YndB with AHSA1/START domain [Croceibacterium atlanticum]